MATIDEFLAVDMRVGRILAVESFHRARNPSYKIQIDFGSELGTRWSSAQARLAYTPEQLLGRLVIAVVNLPARNVAGFLSEVLLLGVIAGDGALSLLQPDRDAPPGARVH